MPHDSRAFQRRLVTGSILVDIHVAAHRCFFRIDSIHHAVPAQDSKSSEILLGVRDQICEDEDSLSADDIQ